MCKQSVKEANLTAEITYAKRNQEGVYKVGLSVKCCTRDLKVTPLIMASSRCKVNRHTNVIIWSTFSRSKAIADVP